MKPGLARPVTPADSTTFRAGLASFLVHATIMCLLIGGGLYYPKLLSFRLTTPEPKSPPMVLTLVEIPPPPPPVVPAPVPVPSPATSGLPRIDSSPRGHASTHSANQASRS